MFTSYNETISWLFGLQKFGIKLGLEKITRLLELLGNPQNTLRCIHIAGTNGKGSTAAYLHSIYCHAGYKPGLFTSPHLVDFTERIVIGGVPIKPEEVVDHVNYLRSLCLNNKLENITFFEFITALALLFFAQNGADPVILETGMGGRLDATNVVIPLMSIITSVSLEHTAYLGPTLMHIAAEKAGIIKYGRPCVSGVTRPSLRDCIRKVCRARRSELFEYGRDFSIHSMSDGYSYQSRSLKMHRLKPGLSGLHQARNAAISVTAADYLRDCGYPLHDAAIGTGIQSCFWPGRLESVQVQSRHIVLDGAHNPAAWGVLERSLKRDFAYRRLVFIVGVMNDKNIRPLIRLVSAAHTSIFFKPVMDRSADRQYLEKYVVFSRKKRVFWCEKIVEALDTALTRTTEQDLICVTGSLFAVGEAREVLCASGTDPSGRIAL